MTTVSDKLAECLNAKYRVNGEFNWAKLGEAMRNMSCSVPPCRALEGMADNLWLLHRSGDEPFIKMKNGKWCQKKSADQPKSSTAKRNKKSHNKELKKKTDHHVPDDYEPVEEAHNNQEIIAGAALNDEEEAEIDITKLNEALFERILDQSGEPHVPKRKYKGSEDTDAKPLNLWDLLVDDDSNYTTLSNFFCFANLIHVSQTSCAADITTCIITFAPYLYIGKASDL